MLSCWWSPPIISQRRRVCSSTSKPLPKAPAFPVSCIMCPQGRLPASQQRRLSGYPRSDNIVGIKEASGNLEQVAKIIQGTDNDFLVWSGNDTDTLPILALGGYGVISVASHLVGNQIKQMIEEFLGAKTQEAAVIHRELLPLINALFIISNPIPIKYALNYIGFPVGKPRLPLTEPDERSKAVIEATLKNYHIDLPATVLKK